MSQNKHTCRRVSRSRYAANFAWFRSSTQRRKDRRAIRLTARVYVKLGKPGMARFMLRRARNV